uniref:Uncharacterized protein LOC111117059 n=1 Tax=Crassostrea virginica TaxID=6565 RepID=A0A8B8C7X3_CRAVI|nr:uncharacterized protein LOC111117059 [Crassostrea virginica]
MKIIITSLLFLTAVSGEKDPSCANWKAGVDQLNANRNHPAWPGSGLDFSCKYHPEKCEQIDCVGKFDNPIVGSFQFCWNMVLNHCDNPINMDVSIGIDKFNYKFYERVSHSNKYPLSIQSKNFSVSGVPIHEYVSFTLVKMNDTAVKLGMQLSTEICLPNLGCTVSSKIPLMPDNVVPVSKCQKVTVTPKPKTPRCSGGGGSGAPSVDWSKLLSTTLPPISTTRSATYGKNCSISQLIEQCGQNEMCKQGRCDCTPRYPLCARTGLCQTVENCEMGIIPHIPGITASPHKDPHNGPQTSGPTNKTAVIVGSTLGVIVVLVIVVGVILWKRSRSRYNTHHLLLTEEDTDGII